MPKRLPKLWGWWRRAAPPACPLLPQPPRRSWRLDDPIVRLTPWDVLTPRDLTEGVLVIGNTGSGKSSTSGAILAKSTLLDGWALVALDTKSDDASGLERVCKETGRSGDLRIIRPGGPHHFNLMQYELRRSGPPTAHTLRLAKLLTEVFREGRAQIAPTDAGEFFDQQMQLMLCCMLDVFIQAQEPLTFGALRRFLHTVPKSKAERDDDAWRSTYSYAVLARAAANAKDDAAIRINETASNHFLEALVTMNERTIGDTLSTIDGSLFQLDRDPMRQLLDSPHGCSFTPDDLENGAVIVIDCSVSEWGSVGGMATRAFKKTIMDYLRRRPLNGDATRPVMIFSDEYQSYASRSDADFSNVCRSQRVSTVYLTQSLANLEAVFGSDAHTQSLINSLTLHIYHCTSGSTADAIQQRIAQAWRHMESTSHSGWSQDQRQSQNVNVSESIHPQLLASELTRLSCGGPANAFLVDAIAFKPGRRFVASGGLPFVRVQFRQE